MAGEFDLLGNAPGHGVREMIYQEDQLRFAFQLNWSLSVFGVNDIPESRQWLDELCRSTETDGVRVLEYRGKSRATHQFLLSTDPSVAPVAIVRSVKGRLQYLLRGESPKAFRRNYWLQSVGDAHNEVLEGYVARQASRHPMADPRVQQFIESLQYFDPSVDLKTVHTNAYGKHLVNLHLVLENRDHLADIREEALQRTRDTIVRVANKHAHRLARIGLLSNHLHILLGCGMQQDPLKIAASYMNNIAYAHGMKAVLAPSFFVGTFGPYDLAAIRNCLPARQS